MHHPTDLRIAELRCETVASEFRTPLKFGGNVVTHSTNFHVHAVVETRDGRRGEGDGWMPQGSVWGFPSSAVTRDEADRAGLDLFQRATLATAEYSEYAHPVDIAVTLEETWLGLAADISREMALGEAIPKLYALVCASPIDAALHDAYGKALGLNVYNAYGPDFMSHDLAHYLTPDFAGEYLDAYTSRQPQETLPLYHLVGALDPLTPGDVAQPIGDGLPEHLIAWIAWDDLTHLKIKLNGGDVQWDAERVAAVERAAHEGMAAMGRSDWVYSLDFNERAENVDYILEFLRRVEELAPTAFAFSCLLVHLNRPPGTWWPAVSRHLTPRRTLAASAAASVAVFMLHAPLPPSFAFEPGRFDVDHHAGVSRSFVAMVPPGAIVSAQSPFVPHLAQRREIFVFPRVLTAEYVLIDDYGPKPREDLEAGYDVCRDALPLLGFDLVREEEGIQLWRKARPAEAVPGVPPFCSGQHPVT